jgi:hypothetical protein
LERFLLERNRLSEILAKGNPRTDRRSIREGSSGTTATANADLPRAMKILSRRLRVQLASQPLTIFWLSQHAFDGV